MKIRVAANRDSEVALPGIGLVKPNTWIEVTAEQVAAFELFHGRTLEEAAKSGGLEVQAAEASKETEAPKETSAKKKKEVDS